MVIVGVIWGLISTFWVAYCVLTAGNLMEEPGSYDYELEGEWMRPYGYIGLVIYVVCLGFILFRLSRKKEKKYLVSFIVSMLFGVIASTIYVFCPR